MPLQRRQLLGAALAGVSALLVGCAAATAPPPVPPEVRQALAPTGTLRIAVYPGSPTSLVRGTGDDMRGLTVEVGRELARQLGVPASLVIFERVPQIVDALKAGEADFTITNASPARARDIDFTPPVVLLESGYLVSAASRLTDVSQIDVADVRVGVSQGSTSQAVLTQSLKKATVVPAASVIIAAQMLRNGQLEAFASNKGILFEISASVPGSRVLDGRFGLEQLAVGVPKGRDVAADYLRGFVAEASTQALVREAAQRAGLRGLAAPGSP